MADFSNLAAALAAVVGLTVLAVGRVPIPGRSPARGVLVRLAGAALLLPWPVSRGLSLLAKSAREIDGSPPDTPENAQLITAFIQLLLLLAAGGMALSLTLLASTVGKPRRPSHRNPPPRSYRR